MRVTYAANVDQAAVLKRVYFEGADTIFEGMALCYNQDTTTNVNGQAVPTTAGVTAEGYQNEGKFYYTEKAAAANIPFFAGVVARGSWCGTVGPRFVDIYIPNGAAVPVRASASVTIGDSLYLTAASYTFTNAGGDAYVGKSMETVDRSGTNGLVLAKLMPTASTQNVDVTVAKTADYSVTVADSGKVFTNYGDNGAIVFSLPAAPVAGLKYTFVVAAVYALGIDPGANDKILFGNGADALADGEVLTLTPADANDLGATITVVSIASGDWVVTNAWATSAAAFVIP